jgi:hypothetical protein
MKCHAPPQFSLKLLFTLMTVAWLLLVGMLPAIRATQYIFGWPAPSWHRVPLPLPPPK